MHPQLQPDLTLLFDVPLEVARERLDASRTLDKFEQEQADFFAATPRRIPAPRQPNFRTGSASSIRPGRLPIFEKT